MKFLFVSLLMVATSTLLPAQSVGVGTSSPHSSALFHMQSTDQGVLIPRMTQTQRDGIANPAHGLLVYQSDNTPGFYFNQGTQGAPDWVKIGGDLADFSDGGEPGGKDRSLGNQDHYDLSLITDSTTRMHIQGNGKIGLGRTDPAHELDILAPDPVLRLQSSNDVTFGSSFVYFGYTDTTGFVESARIGKPDAANILELDASDNGAIRLSSGGQEMVRVNAGGFVGIGETTPDAFLEISASGNQLINSRLLMLSSDDAEDGDLLVVENAGNVGIGSSSPGSKLEVNGTIHTTSGNLRLPPTTDSSGVIKMGIDNFAHSFGTENAFLGVGAGNLAATGTGNTGIGESALNTLVDGARNTALGAFALQSLSSGSDNVAIGRSALLVGNGNNNTAVGASALSANQGNDNVALGTSALASSNANYNTGIGTFALDNNILGTHNTAVGYNADVASNGLTNSTVIGANAIVNASNSLVLGGTGTYAVDVGIGTTTPNDILDIVEDAPGIASIMSHENSAIASSSNEVRLIHKLNTDLQSRTAFRIESYFSNITDATRKSRVTFSTADPDLQPVLTFSGQDIGIGTTPALAADVHISRTEGDAILRIEADADDNDATDQPRLQFYQSGGDETAYVGFSNNDENLRLFNQTVNGDLYLGTDGSVRMMIDNQTERVGIGITTPEARLHIEADQGISFLVDDQVNDSSPFIIRDNGDVGVGLYVPQAKMHIIGSASNDPALLVEGVGTGNEDIFLYENSAGTERFRLECDGDLFLNGSQIHSSDLRLKKNVATIANPLEKVTRLRGVNFDWRQDVDGPRSTNRTMGFIAQEVEAVIPHLVQENKSGYKAVAYSNVTALLVEAIKAQQHEIDELKQLVRELGAMVSRD